jgi:hypothetical protein
VPVPSESRIAAVDHKAVQYVARIIAQHNPPLTGDKKAGYAFG